MVDSTIEIFVRIPYNSKLFYGILTILTKNIDFIVVGLLVEYLKGLKVITYLRSKRMEWRYSYVH